MIPWIGGPHSAMNPTAFAAGGRVSARRAGGTKATALNAREPRARAQRRDDAPRRDSRTQRSRPEGRLPKLSHPQGVRLNGHLLRGGAATRTVDHCTSPPFVPGHRTGCFCAAQAARRAATPPRSRMASLGLIGGQAAFGNGVAAVDVVRIWTALSSAG